MQWEYYWFGQVAEEVAQGCEASRFGYPKSWEAPTVLHLAVSISKKNGIWIKFIVGLYSIYFSLRHSYPQLKRFTNQRLKVVIVGDIGEKIREGEYPQRGLS